MILLTMPHRTYSGLGISVFILLILLITCSCQKWDGYDRVEEVALTLRVYEGNNPQGHIVKYYCRKSEGSNVWCPLYNASINDWGLLKGYEYEVSVLKLWKKEPMADGSAVEYEFRKILSKKEAPCLTYDGLIWESIYF